MESSDQLDNEKATFVFNSEDEAKNEKIDENKTNNPTYATMMLKFVIMTGILALPILSYTQVCERPYKLTESEEEIRARGKQLSACLETTRILFFLAISVAGTILIDLEFDALSKLNNFLLSKGYDTLWIHNLISLRKYFLWTVFGLCASVSGKMLFRYTVETIELSMIFSLGWRHWIVSLSACVLVGSLLILIEKIVIQVISVRFHRLYYKERLEENEFSFAALNFLKDQFVVDQPSRIMGRLSFKENRTSPEESAERIYEGLKPANREFLLLQDFTAHFTTEDAEKLFNFLDKDGNGDLTKSEFVNGMKSVFIEKDLIARSLVESDNTIQKLDTLFLAFTIILQILAFFAVFRIDIGSFLATFGTMFVSLSFVFGAPLSQIFESIVFVFITHAFDVGDKITIAGQVYTVKEVGFLSTTLLNNNQIVYYPTYGLKGSEIQNVRRSPYQFEIVDLYISHDVPKEKIDQLQNNLAEFVKTFSRDYGPTVAISGFDVVSHVAMRINVYFEYKSNFQDSGLKSARRNRLMLHLRNQINEIGIQLAPAPT